MTAAQSFSSPEDVAPTTDVMLMCNAVSGAYFVTAAQSLFANRLLQRFTNSSPNIDATKVLTTGASEIQRVFSGEELAAVVSAYMPGIKDIFAFSVAGAALTVLISLVIPSEKLASLDTNKIDEKK
ncbi:hypothetical protein B0H13DRAFT_2387984 [Mycena leptocephala]|nr:hypothetical protein B0H13DRAFT_2387984 [Mycena leptocephala]